MSHSERGQVIGSVAGGLVLAVGGALCGTLWEARRRLGKDKKHKKAFLLIISCEFHTQADRDRFLDEFAKLAQQVATEGDTLAYEVAVADNDPNKVVIYERYASKAALVDVHQKSPAYARFKEATAGLEFKEKAGQSYYETDLGFVPS